MKITKESFGIIALVFFSVYNGIILMALDLAVSEKYIAMFFFIVGALFLVLSLAAKPKE